MIAGPTGSGKTNLLVQILKNNLKMIEPKIQRIIYCYTRDQDIFKCLKDVPQKVEFHEGLVDTNKLDSKINNMIILDDLMDESEKDTNVLKLFTIDSHHKNISVFYLSQNMFSKGKNTRTISLNCHYMILLNNPRDKSQIHFLARQMFPSNPKFLIDCYEDATKVDESSKNYGYILLDFKQTTPDCNRITTDILPHQKRILYKEK